MQPSDQFRRTIYYIYALMLRSAVTIFLLLSFMVQSFDKIFVIMDYHMNKSEFIAACVNKARPKLNCNGQCLLMKKIQEKEDAQHKNPDLKLENKNEVYIVSANYLALGEISANEVSSFRETNSGTPIDHTCPVFHPPGA